MAAERGFEGGAFMIGLTAGCGQLGGSSGLYVLGCDFVNHNKSDWTCQDMLCSTCGAPLQACWRV